MTKELRERMTVLEHPPTAGDQLRERQLMSRRMQLLSVRMAIPIVLLLFGGLAFSGFITPPAPASGADEIARMYRDSNTEIRLGTAFSFLSIILFFPFGAALVTQARRIETSPVLSYAQIAAIGSASIVWVMPWVCWMTAAFRPGRAASEILLLNDLGWLFFTFSFVAFTSWNWCLGLAILTDTRERPIYPRWAGYYNLFVGMTFVPDLLVPFFKTGPFDWRGVVPYYFPFAVYGVWIIVMLVLTVKAIKVEDAENAARYSESREDDPALPSERHEVAGERTPA